MGATESENAGVENVAPDHRDEKRGSIRVPCRLSDPAFQRPQCIIFVHNYMLFMRSLMIPGDFSRELLIRYVVGVEPQPTQRVAQGRPTTVGLLLIQ